MFGKPLSLCALLTLVGLTGTLAEGTAMVKLGTFLTTLVGLGGLFVTIVRMWISMRDRIQALEFRVERLEKGRS